LLLDATGRIEHALGVVETGGATWLIAPAAHLGSIVGFLESMRFTLDVRTDGPGAVGEWALIATPGHPPAAVADGAPLWIWDDPWPGVVAGGTAYAPASSHPGARWRLSVWPVPRRSLDGAVLALVAAGWSAVGPWALDALRIAAWRPWIEAPGVAGSLPHELDWLRTAVHLHKGCYRGQETVAKVHNVGRPPRRLVMLHLDGSTLSLPAPGTPLVLRDAPQDGPIGAVTSAARHHLLGPIGLGLLKRGVDPGAELLAGAVPATQEVIVPPSGESADRPRRPASPGARVPLGPRLGSMGGVGPMATASKGRGLGLARGRG
jgi:folate-binding protein YgfZ